MLLRFPGDFELDPQQLNESTRPRMAVFVLACCRYGFRFRLTFEIDQSTYAILEHVTEWGPYVDFRQPFPGMLYTAKQ